MNEDELIQKQIEDGSAAKGTDADAYRMVFRALKKQPSTKLSDDFAKRVATAAFAPGKSFDWDKFFLIGGIVAFAIAFIYAVVVTGFKLSFGGFKFLSSYPALFLFAVLFIVTLHLLDKRFVHPFSSDSQ